MNTSCMNGAALCFNMSSDQWQIYRNSFIMMLNPLLYCLQLFVFLAMTQSMACINPFNNKQSYAKAVIYQELSMRQTQIIGLFTNLIFCAFNAQKNPMKQVLKLRLTKSQKLAAEPTLINASEHLDAVPVYWTPEPSFLPTCSWPFLSVTGGIIMSTLDPSKHPSPSQRRKTKHFVR